MLYVYLDLSIFNEEYWFELDDDCYARRQMIVNKSKNDYVISCRDDCLAEGIIKLEELEGNKLLISKYCFENKWTDLKKRYEKEWFNTKKDYCLGDKFEGKCLYSNNNGWIVASDNYIGVYNGKLQKKLHAGDMIESYVIGYDEDNMMLILSEKGDR